jgi:hypothetical protein
MIVIVGSDARVQFVADLGSPDARRRGRLFGFLVYLAFQSTRVRRKAGGAGNGQLGLSKREPAGQSRQ